MWDAVFRGGNAVLKVKLGIESEPIPVSGIFPDLALYPNRYAEELEPFKLLGRTLGFRLTSISVCSIRSMNA